MKNRVPVLIEIGVERMPEKRKQMSASVLSPMLPRIWQSIRFPDMDEPAQRRSSNKRFRQQDRLSLKQNAALLEKLPPRAYRSALPRLPRALDELPARQRVPKRQHLRPSRAKPIRNSTNLLHHRAPSCPQPHRSGNHSG